MYGFLCLSPYVLSDIFLFIEDVSPAIFFACDFHVEEVFKLFCLINFSPRNDR